MTDDFAKLFATEHGQVLVTKDACDDDDAFPITIRTAEYGGIVPAMSMKYETAEACDEEFAKFDQEMANKAARSMRSMIDNLSRAA